MLFGFSFFELPGFVALLLLVAFSSLFLLLAAFAFAVIGLGHCSFVIVVFGAHIGKEN